MIQMEHEPVGFNIFSPFVSFSFLSTKVSM